MVGAIYMDQKSANVDHGDRIKEFVTSKTTIVLSSCCCFLIVVMAVYLLLYRKGGSVSMVNNDPGVFSFRKYTL